MEFHSTVRATIENDRPPGPTISQELLMGPPPPDGPETLELAPGPPRRWAGNPGTHVHVQVYTLELRWPIPESRAGVVDSSVLTQLRSYCFGSGA